MGEKYSGGSGGVLANRRRQLVLDQLQRHQAMTLRDLAEQIAVNDQQVEINELCEEAVKEVEVALHHVHAPKLASAGYIEYDSRRRLVALTERGRTLDVDSECEEARATQRERITVDLSRETLDRLHDVITADDRFGARMAYDDVIRAVLAEAARDTAETDETEDEEEAR